MRKRKAPIVLIAVIVVLSGAAVIMNLPASPDAQRTEVMGESHGNDAESIAAQQQKLVRGSQNAARSGPPSEGPSFPLVKNPGATMDIKPQPDDTRISSQWYREDSGRVKSKN